MGGEINPSEDDVDPGDSGKDKKQWRLNALILAGVFLLSVLLPPKYKAFAPLLFAIPVIVNVVNKIRQISEKPANPSEAHSYSPPIPDQISPLEPYTREPKDPKDPRRYKPIG